MKILLNNNSLLNSLRPFKDIGYVPTMGAIHLGHLSLINKSNQSCSKTIVSIFINPKQFDNKMDLKRYPSNLKKDLSILRKTKKVDFVYVPNFTDIFDDKKKSRIIINKKFRVLCAKFRKTHFEGVLDVMNRLTKLVNPKKIFMGKKDFQQFYLVKKYLEKKYRTKVIPCNTIRNKYMLALSSRNILLKKSELFIASKIVKSIINIKKELKKQNSFKKFLEIKKKDMEKMFKIKIEYLENRNIKNLQISNKYLRSKIFLSYYFKDIRFIDNF